MLKKQNQIKDKTTGKQYFSGVLVLTLSTALVKIIGLLYKIPMMNYLGSEGMGYFNSAYEIYTLFFIISTAGIPVAVSIMISESRASGNSRNVSKIFRLSLIILAAIGILGTALMSVFYEQLSSMIHNTYAQLCILAISPTVFFICISSAVRGYFQGMEIMFPTAVSQIIESLGKLLLGLSFAIWAINRGYSMPQVAAFAVLGLTAGVAISMLFLLICKFAYGSRETLMSASDVAQRDCEIIVRLFKISVPITLSSMIMSLTRIIDMTMILRRLTAIGYSEEMANSIYGSYSTMAVSVFNLPTTFITAIALPLVPMLSSAFERGDGDKEKSVIFSATKLTSIVSFPSALGIAVFSKPILQLLFSGGESRAEEIAATAPLLSVLGISVFFSCMITLTNAILQAYKMVNKPIISMIAGATVKIISSYILIGIPKINVYGAPISTFLSTLTIVTVNVYFIHKKTGHMESIVKLFVKPFAASFFSVIFGFILYILLQYVHRSSINVIISIVVICAVYAVTSLKIKAVDGEDILMLPMGEKIYALLSRLKLLN